MKNFIVAVFILCFALFTLISTLIIGIVLAVIGFVLSKTQKKPFISFKATEEERSNAIEGEYTDVTHY